MGKSNGNGAEGTVLGLDLSTQSLSAVVLALPALVAEYETAVVFARDLPYFNTDAGVHKAEGGTVTQPVQMFVEAFDKVLAKMKADGVDLGAIRAVAASGQQHASVFWNEDSDKALRDVDAAAPLAAQLASAFSVANCPIWMDSSTGAYCKSFEAQLGGASAVADLTGSRAYERFTAHQISKLLHTTPGLLERTSRIALVSSFVATLLCGKHAPIDHSDGSGMNLLDLRKLDWSQECLLACARNAVLGPDKAAAAHADQGGDQGKEAAERVASRLRELLGEPVAPHAVVGRVSPYLHARFGFSADCVVVASSGDNPCTLASMRLDQPTTVCISLGTSDTLFGSLAALPPADQRPASEGHIFVNPVAPSEYMLMLCFKNGALTRSTVRDEALARLPTPPPKADDKAAWGEFSRALRARSVPGNEGCLGFFFHFPEITPHVPKAVVQRFDAEGGRVGQFASPEMEVRALVEGQAMSMSVHAARLGLCVGRVNATGGGSNNPELLQVYSDVFGVPVWRLVAGSGGAALGAAFRAKHGLECHLAGAFVAFADAIQPKQAHQEEGEVFARVCEPNPNASQVYRELQPRFEALEGVVVAQSQGM